METDRIVTFTALGVEHQVTIKGAKSDEEARDLVTTEIAKRFVDTFSIKAITAVRPRRSFRSLFDTYADGFRVFAQKFVPAQ